LPHGISRDASEMVTWLELYGFETSNSVTDSLRLLEPSSTVQSPSLAAADNRLTIDLQGDSALRSAALYLELAAAKVATVDKITVSITHCPDAFWLLGYLPRLVKRGLTVKADCQLARDSERVSLSFDERGSPILAERPQSSSRFAFDQSVIEVMLAPSLTNDQPISAMNLASNEPAANEYPTSPPKKPPATDSPHLSNATLNNRYQESLARGLSISDELWAELKRYGENTLVEADEQSRQGAGPSE
jgi:hypothetical protein